MGSDTAVSVVVRIRPQVTCELIDMCQVCTSVTPGEPQVWLGKDKAFTFNHVFDSNSTQSEIYETCVKQLVDGCFDGYNATILAYGQTGSGKTYTMGTGFEQNSQATDKGIVPRSVQHLFAEIERRKAEANEKSQPVPAFKVTAQFLELYNEDIIDLLDNDVNKEHQIKIVQENGNISTFGATNRQVNSADEAFECLRVGALSRTTAFTKMNSQSSRSHAIFTIMIRQTIDVTQDTCTEQSLNTLYAKFHFVDLAGSERLKRTGATGERAKEGISINTGLLCLGNVISALGDKSKKSTHVPYRDSKLTRLLQDSLGGNSQTLMIACISPSDRDFMETLSTLSYANRAKNIKNKVVINQDSSSQTIALLKKEIQTLQLEILDLKQGKRLISDDGTEYINDLYHENSMLLSENQDLKNRIKALQKANEKLVERNTGIITDRECVNFPEVKDLVSKYVTENEALKLKLIEMEEAFSHQRKQLQNHAGLASGIFDTDISTDKVIEDANRELKKLKSLGKIVNNSLHGNETETSIPSNQDSCGSNETDGDEDDEEHIDTSEDNSEDNDIQLRKKELELLTDDILSKESLIAQLEKSKRQMQFLKHNYETKLSQLRNQITEIIVERDQVLAKLTESGSKTEENVKKIQEDYDKRIKSFQNDIRKLQEAKKEHATVMRNQAKYEQQLKKLRNEVQDMKRQRVTIMNRMKEEAIRHRHTELQSYRRIAQLTKQERIKDVKIKNLERDNYRIKQALKRKEAEIKALKTKRRMSKTPLELNKEVDDFMYSFSYNNKH